MTRMRRRTTISILSDIVSLSRGKHNLRFGTEIFRNQFNEHPDATDGTLTFSPFPIFCLVYRRGLSVQVAMAHRHPTFSWRWPAPRSRTAGLRSTAAHFFAVDDWKISPALTINLGLRLEANGQQSEAHGGLANFYPEFYIRPPPGGFTNPSTSGFVLADNYKGPALKGFRAKNSTLLNNPIQLHPEPRIGLAWRPFSSRDIVVRAGYGVYANRLSFYGAAQTSPSSPFPILEESDRRRQCSIHLQHPFPTLPPAFVFPNFIGTCCQARHTRGIAPRSSWFHRSRFQGGDDPALWSGDSVPAQQLFVLARLRRRQGHSPYRITEQQPARPGQSHKSCKWVDHQLGHQCRRTSTFSRNCSPVFYLESDGNSSYNSLQATINKRLSHGLQFLAAYTFSKSIDTAGDSIGSAAFGFYGNRFLASRHSTIKTIWPLSEVLRILIADTDLCSANLGTATAGEP